MYSKKSIKMPKKEQLIAVGDKTNARVSVGCGMFLFHQMHAQARIQTEKPYFFSNFKTCSMFKSITFHTLTLSHHQSKTSINSLITKLNRNFNSKKTKDILSTRKCYK